MGFAIVGIGISFKSGEFSIAISEADRTLRREGARRGDYLAAASLLTTLPPLVDFVRAGLFAVKNSAEYQRSLFSFTDSVTNIGKAVSGRF